jgi:hypothetical protein
MLTYECPNGNPMGAIWSIELVPPSQIQKQMFEGHKGFKNKKEAEEFVGQYMALWNRLTAHQDPSTPFKLFKVKPPTNDDELINLYATRNEEFKGFDEFLEDDFIPEYDFDPEDEEMQEVSATQAKSIKDVAHSGLIICLLFLTRGA